MPTSYPRSDQLVTCGELGEEEFLYVGTQDQIVCREPIAQNSNGTSVRFSKLRFDRRTGVIRAQPIDPLVDQVL